MHLSDLKGWSQDPPFLSPSFKGFKGQQPRGQQFSGQKLYLSWAVSERGESVFFCYYQLLLWCTYMLFECTVIPFFCNASCYGTVFWISVENNVDNTLILQLISIYAELRALQFFTLPFQWLSNGKAVRVCKKLREVQSGQLTSTG